ncbi:MAG: DUF4087 domain-containing protein [Cyanobacteria bacterium J06628_6]
MKPYFFCILALVLLGLVPSSRAVERRCGWIDNPTPANWWITDRDGSWTLSVQGGYSAAGGEHIPAALPGEYVETNGYYGYYCGCMDVAADANTMRIDEIYAGEALPLSTCYADPALPDRSGG